jgi:hypothetical protein
MLITSKKGIYSLLRKDLEQTAKCRPFLEQTGSGQQLTGTGVLRLAGEVENLVQFHPGVRKIF